MKTRRALCRLFALSCALSLSSCFFGRDNINEPIDVQAVRSLVPGQSTAKECVEVLGGPSDVVQLGRRFAYRYDHTLRKSAGTLLILFVLFNEDTRQDRVWLFFDENSVLTHVGSTFAGHRPQYAFTWEDIHEPSDHASEDRDRGLTGGGGGR